MIALSATVPPTAGPAVVGAYSVEQRVPRVQHVPEWHPLADRGRGS